MHNGIKASSIFVIETNEEWKVSIGEFQLATSGKEETMLLNVDEKDKYYLAPELIKGNEFYGDLSESTSDMFSLGVLVY